MNIHRKVAFGLCLAMLISEAHAQTCRASWYGYSKDLKRRTANGEIFDPQAMTAAHLSLPFGTKVRVTHNGREVIVRITDRGPAKWTGKCIDLSKGAAARLGMVEKGVGVVDLEVLK